MSSELEREVRQEIEALHQFFVGWFSGELPESEFEAGFLGRFDPGFVLIPPAGSLLQLEDLASSIRAGHASNPAFRIAIRKVRVQRVLDRHVLATYEEWQRNARASQPPDNGRIATVLFEQARPLRWLHVHETWLPEPVQSAGPYDF
ncbi:MAG: hypothetical protein ACR2P8_01020 [Myxococcota bacterium]